MDRASAFPPSHVGGDRMSCRQSHVAKCRPALPAQREILFRPDCIEIIRRIRMKLRSLALLALVLPGLAQAENWPVWRGPRLDGTSLEKNIPIHWTGASNVAWKTPLPGFGHASPIVWGDRVFTVAVVSNDQARVLLCLDRKSGELLWQRTVL